MPAAAVAARCHIANGSTRKAQKILRATWERARHPDLAELMARSVPGMRPEARFERVHDLVGSTTEDLENAHALAKAAVPARRLDVGPGQLFPATSRIIRPPASAR